MSCILTFKIRDRIVEVPHDGTLLQDPQLNDNLLHILRNSEKWQEIFSLLEDKIRNKVGIYNELQLKDLQGIDGLIGNCNLQFLQDQFPLVEFPENIDADILFLDDIKLEGKVHFGRVKKADGKILYIVRNNEYEIMQLANFLNVRKALENGFSFSESSKTYKILNQLKTNKGFKSINELLEDFSINKDKYQKIKLTYEGNTILAYSYLDDTLRDILKLYNRKSYDDEFTNSLNSLIKFNKSNNNTYSGELNINTLYTLVKTYYPNLVTDMNVTKFKNTFTKSSKELADIFDEQEIKNSKSGFDALLRRLIKDREFPYIVKLVDGINIKFKTKPRTIEERFDISYSTIDQMEIIDSDYNGYKIYKHTVDGVTYYYPSKHYLTESTISDRFESLQEAKDYIDSYIENQDINKNSYLEFNNLEEPKSYQYIPVGTIVEVLDVPINVKQTILQNQLLQKGSTKKDFDKIVDQLELTEPLKNRIKEKLNTSEKRLLFIYKINESKELTPDNINTIVNSIINAPKKYFYIESVISKKIQDFTGYDKQYEYKVIQTEPNIIEQYKKQKNIPSVRLITAIANSLNQRFETNVVAQTYEVLKEQFPNLDERVKAFINNGTIYVNLTSAKSSDLLHEYTHLILGVLKSDPNSRNIYEQLINKLAMTTEGKNKIDRIRLSYPESTEMDLREEAFASLYGEYLSGRGSDIDNIFKAQEKYLKSQNQNIFDLSSETNLSMIYGKTMKSIFARFSSDVAAKLSEGTGLDFSETINTRKKQNWINKQVSDGNIIENCYG